jgi:predicted O-linked N-acetylglucosamine transferase (SPINDLY family)
MSKIQTISVKGKPYVTVAERVRLVHEQERVFEVLDSTFQDVVGRVLCKVTILVDGKRYTGSAEAKLFNAAPKSADETNPFECAETSALGRALAFAGLGTVDGIASFDEIARGMSRDEVQATAEAMATEQQITNIGKLANTLKRDMPDTSTLTFDAAAQLLRNLAAECRSTKQPQKAS